MLNEVIKHVAITLKGITPLLMSRYPMDRPADMNKLKPEEIAEIAAYRIPGGKELYIPGEAIRSAMINGATYVKGKGRSTLKKEAAACLQIDKEYVGLGTELYAIDTRTAVNHNMGKGGTRIVVHRPKIQDWEISFVLEWDNTLISETQLRQVVENMASRAGLLSFRPNKGGSFGRSMITKWEVLAE